MYLVELRPDREALFQSTEAFTTIRRGDVTAHSRIYHRATSKWISVTLHPQFKAAAAARPSEPLRPLPRQQWTFLPPAEAGEPEPGHGMAAVDGIGGDWLCWRRHVRRGGCAPGGGAGRGSADAGV